MKNCSYSNIDFIFKLCPSEDDEQDISKSSDDLARIFCKQSPNYSTTYCQTWEQTSILKQLLTFSNPNLMEITINKTNPRAQQQIVANLDKLKTKQWQNIKQWQAITIIL
jgi:hypothetical protein